MGSWSRRGSIDKNIDLITESVLASILSIFNNDFDNNKMA